MSLGAKAFTTRAAIRMEGSEPVVWPIPTVTYGGVTFDDNGSGAAAKVAAWTAVPEPTSGLLLLIGLAGIALKRKRNKA